MKKLLTTLLVSLAILGGLLGYAKYKGIDGDMVPSGIISPDLLSGIDEIQNEIIVPEIIPVATPSPLPERLKSGSEEEASTAYVENVVESEEEEWKDDETEEANEDTGDIHNDYDHYMYVYNELPDAGKELYDILYDATVNFKDRVNVPTRDMEVIDRIFNCMMLDHPEIFYVTGYRCIRYTQGDTVKQLAFSPSYCYTESQVTEIKPLLESKADSIVGLISPDSSDYDKIKFAYNYIVLNTEYDLNSSDNQNIISVLLNGRSVCQGYAKTMQLLLNKMNVPCCLVTGSVSTGERHAWNVIKADGEWYYADVTWGDASYQTSSDADNAFVSDVNYDYLLVTSPEINMTHIADNYIDYPAASAIMDNYYVKEGMYLTAYDPNLIGRIFDYQRSIGSKSVTLKCSDINVYNQVYSELIDNQKIFDYIGTGRVNYRTDDTMNKFVFAIQ